MKKFTTLMLAMMLALSLTACGANNSAPAKTTTNETASTEATVETENADAAETTAETAADTKEAAASFTVVVTDLNGTETVFEYSSDAATVGEALLAEGLIAGEDSDYGLYVTEVNGMTADWDADQTYWAFLIDGEYAVTGVDSTEITDGATYSFVLTGPEETASEEASAEVTVLGEGAVVFNFTVADLEGAETAYEIHTDETTVGAALLALEVIAGEDSDYGLYVTEVNGITADWDADKTYWAFYIDGEYAVTGVDTTEITEGAAYSFVLTKGE